MRMVALQGLEHHSEVCQVCTGNRNVGPTLLHGEIRPSGVVSCCTSQSALKEQVAAMPQSMSSARQSRFPP